jgi:DNA polymerase-3 subunit delta'
VRLSEIRHQERAVSIIRRALSSGRTHHAYLFEGPEGVGKQTAAQALAARLLCDEPEDADACTQCQSCRLLAAGNHPDFHLIHRGLHKFHPDRTIRASKGLFIAVEVVRHFLIQPATTTPSLGRCRVFLIREAERMNEQAQNALLKTLEEPPGQARLILVTSSGARLLPTIRSRCQRVAFDLLPPAFVEQQLTARVGMDTAAARTLAGLAQGRLGTALRWYRVGLPGALGEVGACLRQRRDMLPQDFATTLVEIAEGLALRAIETRGEDEEAGAELVDSEENRGTGSSKSGGKTIPTDDFREALKLVLMLVAAVYRDALVVQIRQSDRLRHLPLELDVVGRLAADLSLEQLDACIKAVTEAEWMLDRNVAPKLACERLAIALSGELAGA